MMAMESNHLRCLKPDFSSFLAYFCGIRHFLWWLWDAQDAGSSLHPSSTRRASSYDGGAGPLGHPETCGERENPVGSSRGFEDFDGKEQFLLIWTCRKRTKPRLESHLTFFIQILHIHGNCIERSATTVVILLENLSHRTNFMAQSYSAIFQGMEMTIQLGQLGFPKHHPKHGG